MLIIIEFYRYKIDARHTWNEYARSAKPAYENIIWAQQHYILGIYIDTDIVFIKICG